MWRGLAVGAVAGALWGVVARLFMRLLTDEPGFSWSGTLFILGLATLAGACVGLVHGARTSGRSGWWRLVAVPALALFAGPGVLLAPAAVGMAAVLRGRAAVRALGALVVAVSPAVAVATSPTSPTTTQWVGLAVMVLSAAPLGWALAQVVGRWRPRPVVAAVVAPDRVGGGDVVPAVA